MNTPIATRNSADWVDPRSPNVTPASGVYSQPYYLPWTGEVGFSAKDMTAGVLIAIIMIGPLAAAAIGRMMS